MREILFRGKRTDNGEWVEGYFVEQNYPEYHAYIIRSLTADIDDKYIDIMECDIVEVDPETVGQYIGLTDKNSVKIFEGDIFCMATETNEKIFATVNFGEYKDDNALDDDHFIGWYLSCKLDGDDKTVNVSILNGQSDGMLVIEMSEIVGNVYNTPELLKGE